MPKDLPSRVGEMLNRSVSSIEDRNAGWQSALDLILAEFNCPVGTIHQLDEATGLLHLLVRRGIPDAILDRVSRIPVGKGMAGLAAERRECVEVCNLQTDSSGDAKPGAKLTGMEGSIAVPMLIGTPTQPIPPITSTRGNMFGSSESNPIQTLRKAIDMPTKIPADASKKLTS